MMRERLPSFERNSLGETYLQAEATNPSTSMAEVDVVPDRASIADAYKEYCRANRAVQSAISRHNRALRALKAVTAEVDTDKAIAVGRDVVGVKTRRGGSSPRSSQPFRTPDHMGRPARGVTSMVVNNVGRGKRAR